MNLAASNFIFLMTLGLPHAIFIFYWKFTYTDSDCRADLFLARSSRGLAICLTCLLSCFQCVTLASSSVRWLYFKIRLQKYLTPVIVFLSLLSLTSSLNAALYPVAYYNATDNHSFSLGYCFVLYPTRFLFQAIGFITFSRDLVFVILMALASTYILLILHRHRKQMKGKRSSERKQEATAEQQASKTIVTLVVLYVFFFGLDNSIWFYQIAVGEAFKEITDIRHYLSFCFPTIFPVIILLFNQKLQNKIGPCVKTQLSHLQAVSSIQ
ncbi:olfactory receptor class A-like protein 1 [Protopterus annectens]|uniref:olfactory receptor class A-like protein 1 n=1 Tax=Protopterus annectens TaxID=7888 RepID=UPI001CF9BAF8|nr:olfactory receptor class A-like protein 1 [Protopterus annectens]